MSEQELVGRSGLPAGVREFRGDFEGHITVRAGATGVDALERYAGQRNIKFTHIVLARGRVCDQPMVTVRRSGTLAAVRDSVSELVEDMRGAGFAVVRVKLEASPWADGVPETDTAARELGDGYYFEHHIKLVLDAEDDLARLSAIAVAHQAHLSANARRVRADGRLERFVTQRCRSVGNRGAESRFDALLTALADYEVRSAEREFVVFDTAESIDDGWIVEEVAAS
ncbi:hypothetical protein [Nocardia sp. NPDC004604]|uniref:hypothetical protein n=1 Tax=Nocardia sp. NPDC004604 TaxID=3157013 RepID=UPI0033B5A288